LPLVGTYEIYVYIPYESGTSDGMISVSDGTYTKEYSVNNLSAYQGGFGDVTADSWYARDVQAIVESGIMNGDSEGHFRPEAPISREEMAKVLVNAYCMKNSTNDIPDIELSHTDNSEIAPWAAGYVQKAAALKLIFGMDDGSFMPKGNMTRAQGAAVIYRLVH